MKELLDGKVPTRMELFTNMDDNIYEYCMKYSKENPFKRYMDFYMKFMNYRWKNLRFTLELEESFCS